MIGPVLYTSAVVAFFVGVACLLGLLVWWTCPGLERWWARITRRPGREVEISWLAVVGGWVVCPKRGEEIRAWDICQACRYFVGFESPCADQGWVKCRAEKARKKEVKSGR